MQISVSVGRDVRPSCEVLQCAACLFNSECFPSQRLQHVRSSIMMRAFSHHILRTMQIHRFEPLRIFVEATVSAVSVLQVQDEPPAAVNSHIDTTQEVTALTRSLLTSLLCQKCPAFSTS